MKTFPLLPRWRHLLQVLSVSLLAAHGAQAKTIPRMKWVIQLKRFT